METTEEPIIRINDIFDALTINLDNCHQLIRLLLEFKEKCICHKSQLNEEIDKYLMIYEQINQKNDQQHSSDHFSGNQQTFKHKDYICDLCGSNFRNKSGLKRHKLIHSKKQFQCNICGKSFNQTNHLTRHQLISHSNINIDDICIEDSVINESEIKKNAKNMFECNECHIEFETGYHFRRHLYSHSKPLKCLFCDKRFGQKSNVKSHYMRVHNRNPESKLKDKSKPKDSFECQWEGCGQEFKDGVSMRRHESVHSGEKPYKCEVCDKSYRLKSNFDEHCLLLHSSYEKPPAIENFESSEDSRQFKHDGHFYCCKICGQKYGAFSMVRRHLYTHSSNKPFKCSFNGCLMSFSQKGNYLSHYLRIHSQNKTPLNRRQAILRKRRHRNQIFQCPKCPQSFTKEPPLEFHLEAVHNQNNPHNCPIEGCSARLRDSGGLEQHLKRHQNQFTCQFEDCEYRTHSKSHYQVHMSKHTGIELFKCDICEHSFDFLGKLLTHKQKVHSIEFPLTCDWPGCQNAYKSVAGLRKHMTLHTGEQKYLCSWPECGAKFRHLAYLKNHMSGHTCERPFKCDICQKGFGTNDYLRSHRKRLHNMTSRTKLSQ